MSHTDKTRPYWVQILDPDLIKSVRLKEHHHCYHAECDLGPWMPKARQGRSGRIFGRPPQCTLWPRYADNNKIYGRRPNKATRRALGFEPRNRMLLRKLRREWKLETIREDIDSTLYTPRRHCQVRDTWMFD